MLDILLCVALFAVSCLTPALAVSVLPPLDGAAFALAILLPAALLAIRLSFAFLEGTLNGPGDLRRCIREQRPSLIYWSIRALLTALLATLLVLAYVLLRRHTF
ncbi:hypothetical protein [Pseudomonas sp. RIT-PI-AD]|uniref:hypothetical protein n=1 Tax=Pseudomonas sp. RIT-PI-AD TaxID=3035294 RepID=UPI0021D94E4A|nr:hypothetical protein [Pseudomonas sp. RIT-PI-AD]